MKRYTSSSTVRPLEWDKSSGTKIYHNFNVVEVPASDDTPIMYHYDVEEYDTQEYMDSQDKRIQSLEADNESLKSESVSTMLAITEVYELLLGG